jgi:hypothetical protein
MSAHAFPIPLLPGAGREVFGDDGRAARHHLAEAEQAGFSLLRHDGDGGGAQVETQRTRCDRRLGFLVGQALHDELGVGAIALAVGPLRPRAGGAAAHVLDALPETVLDHRVVPIDERRQVVVMLDEPAHVASFGRLQHETYPAFVGLALDAVQTSPTTAQPDLASLPHTDPLRRLKGTGRQLLGGLTVHAVGDPTGCGRIGPHPLEALHRLSQQGVVETAI